MTKARDTANFISTGVPNSLITLDAAEIPNLDTAKITTGTLANARVADLPTSKITTGTFADARISASSVTQHASDYVSWQSVVTASTLTAVAGRGYPINTTSNACTVTLPASASVGDTIKFVDYARKWSTNKITLNRNSLKYQGGELNAEYNTVGQSVTITYIDATQGWIPTVDDDVSDKSIFASGGTETSYSGFKVHTFLTSGTFTVLSGKAMDIMMIAGGGGGGGWHSGGGGAGGMIVAASASNTIAAGSYTIVVGAGATATDYTGNVGTNTTGFGDTCNGGGGAGYYNGIVGTTGGSGAGGSSEASVSAGTGTSGNQGNPSTLTGTGYGNDGGDMVANHDGGGGGGAGGAGEDGNSGVQGDGGLGLDNLYRTGSNVTYAGGGEGGTWGGSRRVTHNGLAGGGGIGSAGNEATAPTNGVEYKGAGGGGTGGQGNNVAYTGGNGGKGIVVIRYAV